MKDFLKGAFQLGAGFAVALLTAESIVRCSEYAKEKYHSVKEKIKNRKAEKSDLIEEFEEELEEV